MGEKVWPGREHPLGATADEEGVNFAIYSSGAERVEICIFDEQDPSRELRRIPLPETTAHVWHGDVPALRPSGAAPATAPARAGATIGRRGSGTTATSSPSPRTRARCPAVWTSTSR